MPRYVDADGTMIGTVAGAVLVVPYPYIQVLRKLPDGRFFNYHVEVLNEGSNPWAVGSQPVDTEDAFGFFYTTTDCTGTAYMLPAEGMVVITDGFSSDAVGRPFIRDETLHYPGGTAETVTAQSRQTWQDGSTPWGAAGTCEELTGGSPAKYYPVQTLVLEEGFTPPFRIE